MINKIKEFLLEVQVEMGKVSWPSKEELMGSTVVVIFISTILTIFVFAVDRMLKTVMEVIL